ncbi:MAG TPA: thioredoxin [Treponema sp.]|jgi:thioredoxin 1|nr:thioredoxin [Treponema sp.]
MALAITEQNFKTEVLESSIPVLVDFWASWCGPCQMMGPVVDQLSNELEGKVKVCKVNVDENPNLAQKYDVMSIPNFILFKNGAVAGQQIGGVPKETLLNLVNA